VSIPKDDKTLNWKIPSRIGHNNRLLVRRGWGKSWNERQPCVKGQSLLLEAKTEDCLSNLTADVKDDYSLRCHLICQPGAKETQLSHKPRALSLWNLSIQWLTSDFYLSMVRHIPRGQSLYIQKKYIYKIQYKCDKKKTMQKKMYPSTTTTVCTHVCIQSLEKNKLIQESHDWMYEWDSGLLATLCSLLHFHSNFPPQFEKQKAALFAALTFLCSLPHRLACNNTHMQTHSSRIGPTAHHRKESKLLF